jgi:hypothetical protein
LTSVTSSRTISDCFQLLVCRQMFEESDPVGVLDHLQHFEFATDEFGQHANLDRRESNHSHPGGSPHVDVAVGQPPDVESCLDVPGSSQLCRQGCVSGGRVGGR